jgi:adenosylcobinamide-phosphate synthase
MLSAFTILTAAALDLLIGDPLGMPHVVRLMGKCVAALEAFFREAFPKTPKGENAAGACLAMSMAFLSFTVPAMPLIALWKLYAPLAFAFESLLCFQLIAAKSLRDESMKVHRSLAVNDLLGAKANVSMIVGRDVTGLDAEGIARAAVETVAENTSDGVVAPLFYMALGGAPLACLYKAANTMDSMVGYKNEKYLNFGFVAAKLDDLLNYIPSRLAAVIMIASAWLLGYDSASAMHIWRRDGRKHASPNAGQTEAVAAGALGLRLAGPAAYFGKPVEKPWIGDEISKISFDDIRRANRMLYTTSAIMAIAATMARLALAFAIIRLAGA